MNTTKRYQHKKLVSKIQLLFFFNQLNSRLNLKTYPKFLFSGNNPLTTLLYIIHSPSPIISRNRIQLTLYCRLIYFMLKIKSNKEMGKTGPLEIRFTIVRQSKNYVLSIQLHQSI